MFLILSILLFSTYFSVNAQSRESWGYVNVRPNAYMFWWLYYTDIVEDYASKPLVIWLQGGPGSSSVGVGNFLEIGPLDVDLQPRNETWLKSANLLFIDNPAGAGFSYVTDKSALAKTNKQIAQDLLTTLTAILQNATEFQKSPLYIFGESYGGKYTVDFSLELLKAIKSKGISCNFKGIALGDSWISPLDSASSYSKYLYATSLIDYVEALSLEPHVTGIQISLETKQFRQATDIYTKLLEAAANRTNKVNIYNILEEDVGPTENNSSMNNSQTSPGLYDFFSGYPQFSQEKLSTLMNGKVREKLGVIPKNVTWGGQARDVFEALYEDFMKPVADSVDKILSSEAIDVNIYSGQLDFLVNVIGTLQWVQKLKWPGINAFNSRLNRRPIVYDQGRTVGFVKSYKQFSFYWILKAGHLVPVDAPVTALQMLDMILSDEE